MFIAIGIVMRQRVTMGIGMRRLWQCSNRSATLLICSVFRKLS